MTLRHCISLQKSQMYLKCTLMKKLSHLISASQQNFVWNKLVLLRSTLLLSTFSNDDHNFLEVFLKSRSCILSCGILCICYFAYSVHVYVHSYIQTSGIELLDIHSIEKWAFFWNHSAGCGSIEETCSNPYSITSKNNRSKTKITVNMYITDPMRNSSHFPTPLNSQNRKNCNDLQPIIR